MLLLIIADRDVGGAVQKNVGRHQHRIVIKADRCVLPIPAGLLLELGHAVEPAEPRYAIEYPGKLGVFRDPALVEDGVYFRIDAAGQEGRRHLARGAGQLRRFMRQGHRMQVDHAIEARTRVLQRHEALDRPEVVAEVQIAGRLNA